MSQPCGCCQGVQASTPAARKNRPGLAALRYRVGTYASFLASMQARLSSQDFPALAGLSVRERDDPAIALLDAWACVADVLTFYQERIANEGYLRTATERRSVLELARLVGYRLRPGVAASVHLAYTVDKNSPLASIPRGARAASIPAPGEQMQVFETSEALEARYAWNAIKPRLYRPHTRETVEKRNELFVKGVANQLKPNDVILVQLGGAYPAPFRVLTSTPDDQHARTLLMLSAIAVSTPALTRMAAGLPAQDAERIEAAAAALFDSLPKPASGTGAIIGRIKAALLALTEAAASGQGSPSAMVADAQAVFRHELARAKLRKAPQGLIDWLEDGAGQLDELHTGFGGGGQNSAKAGANDSAKSGATAGNPVQVNAQMFRNFVNALTASPSLPPASSRKLRRDAAATFAPHADIYPRIMSALLPALGTQLYTGLGSLGAGGTSLRAWVLRRSAPMFGHNAPPAPVIGIEGTASAEPALAGPADVAELDAPYDKIVPGSFALVERAGSTAVVARIGAVEPVSVAKYGMAARVTRLTLDQPWAPGQDSEPDLSVLRAATVHAQAEELELAEEPITEPLSGNDIELDGLYEGLESGRSLIVTGERLIGGTAGVQGAELLMLASVSGSEPRAGDRPHTRIRLGVVGQTGDSDGLAYTYKRDTVTFYANVVHATHGETRREVLGAGNAATPLQRFTLKQPPLTYVSAPTPSGVASTLEVRVNDLLWHEADSVAGLGPDQRAFVTATGDDGATSIIFGDGVHGARLPTGLENLRARYRNGLGRGGNVAREQISLLSDKPLGVAGVINPIRASGGADRETRDVARRNAPLAVTALDRLVSTQDYADFARLFGGVGKAVASRLPAPHGQTVVVTIAGLDDIAIEPTSDLLRNLGAALRQYGDPFVPVALRVRELLALVIEARVKVLPDYDWEVVEPAVRAALLAAFGFEARELGQGVSASDVITVIQQVRGVAWVDLDRLAAISLDSAIKAFVEPAQTSQASDLPGKLAAIVDGVVQQAQLICLQSAVRDTLILNEVTP